MQIPFTSMIREILVRCVAVSMPLLPSILSALFPPSSPVPRRRIQSGIDLRRGMVSGCGVTLGRLPSYCTLLGR